MSQERVSDGQPAASQLSRILPSLRSEPVPTRLCKLCQSNPPEPWPLVASIQSKQLRLPRCEPEPTGGEACARR